MKICYLGTTLNITGGASRVSRELLSKMEEKVEIVSLTTDDALRGINKMKNFFSIAKEIQHHIEGCDIIHALDAFPFGAVAALANRKLRKPLVITAVGTYSVAPIFYPIISTPQKMMMKFFTTYGFKKSNMIIAISKYVENKVKQKFNNKKVQTINWGVDSSKFSTLNKQPHKGKVIIGVGDVKKRKGYHVAIESLAIIKKEFSELKYYIIGFQPHQSYVQELKKIAKENGLEENIEFCGKISEERLKELYSMADVFLLPSINIENVFEGFGLAFLEAATAGVPSVGTLGNGIEDAVINGETGILVPQNDTKATAEAVIKILKNGDLSEKMSRNAIKFASEMSWDKTASEYYQLYRDLIKK